MKGLSREQSRPNTDSLCRPKVEEQLLKLVLGFAAGSFWVVDGVGSWKYY